MSAAQNVTATFNTATTPPPSPQFGTLAMTVNGLPSGSSATLGISGPGGTNLTKTILTGTGVSLSDVAVGSYTITAPNVTVGGTTYSPNAASQTVTVSFGQTTTVNITYTANPTPPPPSGATAAISKASTAVTTAQKGSSNNPALGVNITMGTGATGTLEAVTLQASGTGHDALDISSVKLHLDANGNGAVDAGEMQLAQGTFSSNNGTATLNLSSPRALSASSSTRLLVTLNFNASLAGLPISAALGSAGLALLLGWRSRRRFVAFALAGVLLTLTACPTVEPPTPQTRTYQVTLTSVSLRDASSTAIPASGLPIIGTELSVQK
jgi:hypothetical protein